MAFITESKVRARASTAPFLRKSTISLEDNKPTILKNYDVFLSYSNHEEEELIRGIKQILEDSGLSVYVDKYDDPLLNPENVTRETAEILRDRMRRCKCLLYIYSHNSRESRWMPWELGFFDGLKGTVGILPIVLNEKESFEGQEYLNLYPHIECKIALLTNKEYFYIKRSNEAETALKNWIK